MLILFVGVFITNLRLILFGETLAPEQKKYAGEKILNRKKYNTIRGDENDIVTDFYLSSRICDKFDFLSFISLVIIIFHKNHLKH